MKINKQIIYLLLFIFICHFIDNSTKIIEGFTSTDMVIKFQDSSEKVKHFFIDTICPLYQFLPVDLCGRHGIWNSETCSCDYHLCNKDEHSDVCSFSNNEDKTRPCHVILGPQPDDANFCTQFIDEARCSGLTPIAQEIVILHILNTNIGQAHFGDTATITPVDTTFGDMPSGNIKKYLEPTHQLFIEQGISQSMFTELQAQYILLVQGYIDTDEKLDPTARCQWNGITCQPKDHCVLKTSDHNEDICEDVNTGIDYIDKIYNIHVNDDIYQDPFDTFSQSLIDGGENINDVLQSIHNNISYSGQATLEDYFTYKINSISDGELSYLHIRNMIFFEFLQDYYHYYLKDPTNQASFDSDWFQKECEQFKIDKEGEPLCLYDLNNGLSTCSLNSESTVRQFENSCHTYNSDHTNCRSLSYCEYDVGCKSCPEGTYTIDSFSNVCKKPDDNEIIQTIFGPNSSSIPLDGDTNPRKCFEKTLETVPCYDPSTGSTGSSCPGYQISNLGESQHLYDALNNPGLTNVSADEIPVLKESLGQRSGSSDNILNIFGTVPNDTNTECESCKYDAHLFHDFETLSDTYKASIYGGTGIADGQHRETYYCGVNKKWVRQTDNNYEPYHFPVEESDINGELIDHCNKYDRDKLGCNTNSDTLDSDDNFQFYNQNCIYNENTDKCVSTCNSNLSYAVDSNDNGKCVNCSHGYFPIQRNLNALQFDCEIDPAVLNKSSYCSTGQSRSEMCMWNENFINPENGETGRCQTRDYHIYSEELEGTNGTLVDLQSQTNHTNYDWVRVDNDNVPIMDSCESCHEIGKMYGRVPGECSDCPTGTKLQVTLNDGVYDYQCLKTSYCPPNQNTIHTKKDLDDGQLAQSAQDVCECDHRSYGKGIFPHATGNMGRYVDDLPDYNNVWKTPSCNPTDPSFDDSCFNTKDQDQCELNGDIGCIWIGTGVDGFCACSKSTTDSPNQCSLNYGTDNDMYLSEDFIHDTSGDTTNGLTNQIIIHSFNTSPSISNDNLVANGFINLSGNMDHTTVVADKFLLCNYNGSYGSCESCGDELDYETNTYLSNPKGQKVGDARDINRECSKCNNTEYEQYECKDVCSMKNISYEDDGVEHNQSYISYPFSNYQKYSGIKHVGDDIHSIDRYIEGTDPPVFRPIDYDPIETHTMNKMKSSSQLDPITNNIPRPEFGYIKSIPKAREITRSIVCDPETTPDITHFDTCQNSYSWNCSNLDATSNTDGNLLGGDPTVSTAVGPDYEYFDVANEPIPSFIPLPTTYDRNLHYHKLNNENYENYDYQGGYGEILPQLANRDAIGIRNCEDLSVDNCNNSSRCSYDNDSCSESNILDRYTGDPVDPDYPDAPVSDFSSGGLLRGYEYGSPDSTGSGNARENIIGRHELTFSIIDTPYLFNNSISSSAGLTDLSQHSAQMSVIEGFTGFVGPNFGPTNYVENTNPHSVAAPSAPCADDPICNDIGLAGLVSGPPPATGKCLNRMISAIVALDPGVTQNHQDDAICSTYSEVWSHAEANEMGPCSSWTDQEIATAFSGSGSGSIPSAQNLAAMCPSNCAEALTTLCPVTCDTCPPVSVTSLSEYPENLTYMKRSKDAQVDLLLSDSDVDFSMYNDPTRYRKVDLYDACNQLNETSKEICQNYYINTINTEQLINNEGSPLGQSSADDSLLHRDSNKCKYDDQTNTCYNIEHPLKAYSQTNMKKDIIDHPFKYNDASGYPIHAYREKDFDFFRYLFGFEPSTCVTTEVPECATANGLLREVCDATASGACSFTAGANVSLNTCVTTEVAECAAATDQAACEASHGACTFTDKSYSPNQKKYFHNKPVSHDSPLDTIMGGVVVPGTYWISQMGSPQSGAVGSPQSAVGRFTGPGSESGDPTLTVPTARRTRTIFRESWISEKTSVFFVSEEVPLGGGDRIYYLPTRNGASTGTDNYLDYNDLTRDYRTVLESATAAPVVPRNGPTPQSRTYVSDRRAHDMSVVPLPFVSSDWDSGFDTTGTSHTDGMIGTFTRFNNHGSGLQNLAGRATTHTLVPKNQAFFKQEQIFDRYRQLQTPSAGSPISTIVPLLIVDIGTVAKPQRMVVPLEYIYADSPSDITTDNKWAYYIDTPNAAGTDGDNHLYTVDDDKLHSHVTGLQNEYDTNVNNGIKRYYPLSDTSIKIFLNNDSITKINYYTRGILGNDAGARWEFIAQYSGTQPPSYRGVNCSSRDSGCTALPGEPIFDLRNHITTSTSSDNWNKYPGCDLVSSDLEYYDVPLALDIDPIKLRHKELIKRYWEEKNKVEAVVEVWNEDQYNTCYEALDDLHNLHSDNLDLSNFNQCVSNFMEHKSDADADFSSCNQFGLNASNYTLNADSPRNPNSGINKPNYISSSSTTIDTDTNYFLYGSNADWTDITTQDSTDRAYDAFHACSLGPQSGSTDCGDGHYVWSQFTSFPFNVHNQYQRSVIDIFPNVPGSNNDYEFSLKQNGADGTPLYRLWGDQIIRQSESGLGPGENIVTDPFHRMNVRTIPSGTQEFLPIVNNNMLWSTSVNGEHLRSNLSEPNSPHATNPVTNTQSYFVEKYCALKSFPDTHPSNRISSDPETRVTVDDSNAAIDLADATRSTPISATGFKFTDFIYDCIPDVVNGVSQLMDDLWNIERPTYDQSNQDEISTCENIFSNIENDISRRLIMEKIDDQSFHTDITDVYTSSSLDSNIPTMNDDVSSITIGEIEKYNELSRVRVGGFCKGTNCDETLKKPIEVDERCIGMQTPVNLDNLDDLAEIAIIQQNNIACANTNLKNVSSYTEKKNKCEIRPDSYHCKYIAPKNIIDLNKSKYQYMLFGQNDNKKTIINEHLQTTLPELFNRVGTDVETDADNTNYPTDWSTYKNSLIRMRDRGLYKEPDPADPNTHEMTETELASDTEPIIWRNEIVDQMVRICGEFNNQDLGTGQDRVGSRLPGSIGNDADESLQKFLTDNKLVRTEDLHHYSCRLLPVQDYCRTQGLDDICIYHDECKIRNEIITGWNQNSNIVQPEDLDFDICNYAGGPPDNPGSIKYINAGVYEDWKDANSGIDMTNFDALEFINHGEPELSDIYYDPVLSCTSRKTGYQPKELKLDDHNIISVDSHKNYGLDVFIDGSGNQVRIPELCKHEEMCKPCGEMDSDVMIDILNLNASIKKIYHKTQDGISLFDVTTDGDVIVLNLTSGDFNFPATQPEPSDISQMIESITNTLTDAYSGTTLRQTFDPNDFDPEAVSNSYDSKQCALRKKTE